MSDFPPPVDFLGLPLRPVTTAQFTDALIARAAAGTRTRVTYINAMCVNTAADTPDYAACLRETDVLYADGQAIVWASRRLGVPVPERVNAGDFFPEFFQTCAAEGVKVFLLGSPEGRAEAAAAKMCEMAPGVEIVGTHHGYMTDAITPEVIAQINRSGAQVLIVGMGVPHQERWLWAHWDALTVPVAWCVGATFDYYSGAIRRAPVWMRRAGLEWLFRLALEPVRLFGRYVVGNPRFVWRVLRRKSL